eukprot:4704372-Heterocapsa_arctica.AAC.1
MAVRAYEWPGSWRMTCRVVARSAAGEISRASTESCIVSSAEEIGCARDGDATAPLRCGRALRCSLPGAGLLMDGWVMSSERSQSRWTARPHGCLTEVGKAAGG